MKGSAFIKLNGEEDSAYVDIFDTYGVSFMKGSYVELLKPASTKGYVKNESRLANGVQYVAKPTYAYVAEKKLTVTIYLEASTVSQYVTRLEGFLDKISQGLFLLKIPSRFRVFKLVYSDIKNIKEYSNQFATFTLELIEPNPKDRGVISTT